MYQFRSFKRIRASINLLMLGMYLFLNPPPSPHINTEYSKWKQLNLVYETIYYIQHLSTLDIHKIYSRQFDRKKTSFFCETIVMLKRKFIRFSMPDVHLRGRDN